MSEATPEGQEVSCSLRESILYYAPEDVAARIGNRKEAEEFMATFLNQPNETHSIKEILGWTLDVFTQHFRTNMKALSARELLPKLVLQRLAELTMERLVGIGIRTVAKGRKARF